MAVVEELAVAVRFTDEARLVADIAQVINWVNEQTRPNERRHYSRCPICDNTWWDDSERHNFKCWVPLLKYSLERYQSCEKKENLVEPENP